MRRESGRGEAELPILPLGKQRTSMEIPYCLAPNQLAYSNRNRPI